MKRKIAIVLMICLTMLSASLFVSCNSKKNAENKDGLDSAISVGEKDPQQDKEESLPTEDNKETTPEESQDGDKIIEAEFEQNDVALVDYDQVVQFDGVPVLLKQEGADLTLVGVGRNDEEKLAVTHLKIPSGAYAITKISDRGFRGLKNLKTLEITCETVKSIGTYAFFDCDSLTEVKLPSSVSFFGELTLYGSKFLEIARASNPQKLVIINNIIVDARAAVGDIVIPSTVESISPKAFYYNNNITSISFVGSKITRIPLQCFYGCNNLVSADISGVTSIANFAFKGCSKLSSVSGVSAGLNVIGTGAFQDAVSLTTMDLTGSKVNMTISENAFAECTGLQEVLFPVNISVIGRNAFYKCTALETITFDISTNTLTSIGSCAFSGDYKLKNIVKPSASTPTIGENAFEDTQIAW